MRRMFATVLMLLAIHSYSIAEERPRKVSLWLANDVAAPFQEDRWYSNGLGLEMEDGEALWGIRHEMYTPRNKRTESIVAEDRPYDGELSLVYLRKRPLHSESSGNREILFGGRAGCVGPCAKAKRLQKFVHNDLGFGSDPRGWDQANPSELLLNFIARYRLQSEGRSIFGQLVREETSWGGEIGTDIAKASLETTLEHDIVGGLFGFVGIEGSLVAYNTHIDGRLFSRNNHTKESIPFVARVGFGFGYKATTWEVRYHYDYQTQEFEGQEGRHLFGRVEFSKSY